MKNVLAISALSLLLFSSAFAQSPAPPPQAQVTADITGLYSFVHEGEFVQIEVADGRVTGLVSRFKGEDLEKSDFVDQYFDQAKLEGANLTFRTKAFEGVVFEFTGTVERGPAKTPSDEGYWNIRGTLLERHSTPDGKVSEKRHELTLKSFPQDAEPNPAAHDTREQR